MFNLNFLTPLISDNLAALLLKLKVKNQYVFFAILGLIYGASAYLQDTDVEMLPEAVETFIQTVLLAVLPLISLSTQPFEAKQLSKRLNKLKALKSNYTLNKAKGISKDTETGETIFTATDGHEPTTASEIVESVEYLTEEEFNTALESFTDEQLEELEVHYNSEVTEDYSSQAAKEYTIRAALVFVLIVAVVGFIYYTVKLHV